MDLSPRVSGQCSVPMRAHRRVMVAYVHKQALAQALRLRTEVASLPAADAPMHSSPWWPGKDDLEVAIRGAASRGPPDWIKVLHRLRDLYQRQSKHLPSLSAKLDCDLEDLYTDKERTPACLWKLVELGRDNGRIGSSARFHAAAALRQVGFASADAMFRFFMGRAPATDEEKVSKDKERMSDIKAGIIKASTKAWGCARIIMQPADREGEALTCPFAGDRQACARQGGIRCDQFNSPASWLVAVRGGGTNGAKPGD